MTDLSWMIRPLFLLACLFGGAAFLTMALEAEARREREDDEK